MASLNPLKPQKSVENDIIECLNSPFEPGKYFPLYGYKRLHNGNPLTLHYKSPNKRHGERPIARGFPFIEPDKLIESVAADQIYTAGIPANTVSLNLPKSVISSLPPHIQNLILNKAKVNINNVDLLFTTQNLPWDPNVVLRYRLHYWLHSGNDIDHVVKAGTFRQSPTCGVGIFSFTENEITKKTPRYSAVVVNSHPEDPNAPSKIICSPSNDGVIQGVNFKVSQSFFSFGISQHSQDDPKLRAMVTLHWLLSPEDQKIVSEVSRKVTDLREFILEIKAYGNKTVLNAENGPLSDLIRYLNIAKLDLTKEFTKNKVQDKAVDKKIQHAQREEARLREAVNRRRSEFGNSEFGNADVKGVKENAALGENTQLAVAMSISGSASDNSFSRRDRLDTMLTVLKELGQKAESKRVEIKALIEQYDNLPQKLDHRLAKNLDLMDRITFLRDQLLNQVAVFEILKEGGYKNLPEQEINSFIVKTRNEIDEFREKLEFFQRPVYDLKQAIESEGGAQVVDLPVRAEVYRAPSL